MKIIKNLQAQLFKNSEKCTLYEFDFEDRDMDCGKAIISGRYPDNGYCVNTKCKELIFIIEGNGFLQIEDKRIDFEKNDCILINKNEKFYWNANCTAVIICNPPFNKEQYKFVE